MNVDRSVQQATDVIDVAGIAPPLHPNNDNEPRKDNDDDDVPVLEFLAKARQGHHHDNLLIVSQPADMLFDDSLWCRNSVLFPGYDGKRDYNTYKYHDHKAEATEQETTTSSATCMTTSDSKHNDDSNTNGRSVGDIDMAYVSMYPSREDIDCVYIPSCDEVFHAYDASNAGMALRLRQLLQVEEGLSRYDYDGRNQNMSLHQEQMRLLTQRRMHQSDMQRDVPARDLDEPVDMDACIDDDPLHEPYDPHRTSTWHGSPTDPNVLAHNTMQLHSASTWNGPSRSPPSLTPVRDGQGRNQQSSSSSTFVISSASSFTPYHSAPPLLHNHLMVDNTITSSYRGQSDKKKGKVGKDEKGINSGCLPPLMTAEYITGKSMFSAKRNGGSSSTDSDSPNNSNSNNTVTASSTDPHMQLPGAYNIAKFSYEALEPFLSSSSSESDSDGCKPSAEESAEEVLTADQSTGIVVDSSSLSCTQFTEAQSLVPPPALAFNSVPEEEEKAHHPVNTKHQRQHQHLQHQLQQPYGQHPRQSMMMEHRPKLPPSLTQRPTVANQQAASMMMIERQPQQIPQLLKQRMMMIDKQQNQPWTQLQQPMMIEQSLEQELAAAKIHNAQILPRPQMETSRLGSLRDDGRIVQRQPPATKRHADLTNHHHHHHDDDSYVALPHSRQQQQVYAQQQQQQQQQMYAQQQHQQQQQQSCTQQQQQRYAQQQQHYAQQQQQKQQLLVMKKARKATPLRSRMRSRGSMSSFNSSNSGGGDSNSSTVTPRQQQQQVMASRATSTSTTPSSASLSMLQIEISPGVFLHVHGSAQTGQAMKDGNMVPCQCFACDLALYCINIAECVICPVCRMLSPVDCESRSNVGCGGAGLGITEANYLSWQEEAYIREIPQQQPQHGIRARRRSRF